VNKHREDIAVRMSAPAAGAFQRLRLVQGRADTEPSQAAAAEVPASTRCGLCGLRDRAVTRSRPLSASLAGVITCQRLECGHAWHRTIANVGGIFPGLARNATFAPCDCPDAQRGRP
jgi:hypothetical protein